MLIFTSHNLNHCFESRGTRSLWNVFEAVQKTRSTCFIVSENTRLRLVLLNQIKHCCSFFKHYIKQSDFTMIKQFLTPCYKLFTILRTYIIRFPVLFNETQFQSIRVKSNLVPRVFVPLDQRVGLRETLG